MIVNYLKYTEIYSVYDYMALLLIVTIYLN